MLICWLPEGSALDERVLNQLQVIVEETLNPAITRKVSSRQLPQSIKTYKCLEKEQLVVSWFET